MATDEEKAMKKHYEDLLAQAEKQISEKDREIEELKAQLASK